MDTAMNVESIEIIKPDFAYIYSKVARHVTSAQNYLRTGYKSCAEAELAKAVDAITAFETLSCTVVANPCPPSS
jgi:hypothetical protein